MSNSLTSWLFGPPPPPRAGYSVDKDEVECVDYGTWKGAHPDAHSLEPSYLASAFLGSLHNQIDTSNSGSDGRKAAWDLNGEQELLNRAHPYRDSDAGQDDVLSIFLAVPWEVEGEYMFAPENTPTVHLIDGPMPISISHRTSFENTNAISEDMLLSAENSSPPESTYLILVDREVGPFPAYSSKRMVMFDVPEGAYRRFRGDGPSTDPVASDAPRSSGASHVETTQSMTTLARPHPSDVPREPMTFSLGSKAAYSLAAIKVIVASSMLSEGPQTSESETTRGMEAKEEEEERQGDCTH